MLPHDLAAQLAVRADRVQQELAAGDVARARRDAKDVQRAVVTAIETGRVPAALRQPLVAAVDRLVALMPAPVPKHEGHGKHKGKKKHGEGND